MAKSQTGTVLLFGIFFALVSMVVNTIGSLLSMGYYTNPAYLSVWSKIMMPANGPPPGTSFLMSFIFSFVTGIIFAAVYLGIRNGLPKSWTKGLTYGSLVFLVGAVPGYLMLILLINLPITLVFIWAMESLLVDLVNGVIIAKMAK